MRKTRLDSYGCVSSVNCSAWYLLGVSKRGLNRRNSTSKHWLMFLFADGAKQHAFLLAAPSCVERINWGAELFLFEFCQRNTEYICR